MKTTKVLFLLSLLFLTSACLTGNKSNKTTTEEVQTKEKKTSELVLTENTFGKLNLKKGMPLEKSMLKEVFNNLSISRNIGEQDGPNYVYYKIGTKAIITTPDTENETLSQLLINENSDVTDEFGVKLGMSYSDVKKKRSSMNISTEHYHVYLYKKGSNIAYEMSLENYNGPDKEAYTLDDIKNSRVISIIWK